MRRGRNARSTTSHGKTHEHATAEKKLAGKPGQCSCSLPECGWKYHEGGGEANTRQVMEGLFGLHSLNMQ